MASDRATAKVVLLILALLLATSSRLYTQTIHPIHPSVICPDETQLTTSQHSLTSVIAVDLDGDGLPDVVAASQLPSTIAWYRNNGDGTFSSQHVISTSLLGPTCIFAADLDGDGRIDIVCSSQTDSQGGPLDNVSVAWFKNAGGAPGDGLFAYDSGNPSANLQTVQAGVASALSVAVLDINGDGLPDIVATNANPDNKIAWYRNSGAGNFGWNFLNPSANQNVISTAGLSPASIAVSDIDGDGLLDFVITSVNDNTVAWFKRTLGVGGVPQFTRYVISSNQLRAAACAVGDFDGDGWPDVVCAAPFGNSVTWFRNKTHDASPVAPFFGSPQTITNNARAAFSVAAADLDNDGFPEVIAASLFDNKITWYRNTGAGVFGWNPASPSANERFVSTTNLGAYSVAVADFNQDGSKDVVAGSQDDGKVAVYLGS